MENDEVLTPPITEADTLDRTYDPTYESNSNGAVLATERQIADAIANEDKNITDRLGSMGLTDTEVQVAQACRKFAQKHFSHILQMMAGGVAKASSKIQTQLTEVEARLATVRSVLKCYDQLRTEDRDAWVEEETRLSNMYVQLLGELRRNWEIGNKGAAIIATIRRQNNYRPSRDKKRGFSPEPIEA